jgi:2'-5' RNA ligase
VKRVISAFRLLTPRLYRPGPLLISADADVPAQGIGDFLDATYIAVEKLRAFGFPDECFAGKVHVTSREGTERANGRYFPKKDSAFIFYPQIRGPSDWVWTIIHELAHRVWHKFLPPQAKKVWCEFSNNLGKPITPDAADALTRLVAKHPDRYNLWFFFNKHFGNDLGMFRAWLETKRISNELPSEYSNADPVESFAEVMADIVLCRGRTGMAMKRSGPAMKKVLLSLIAPLRAPQMFEEWLTEQQDESFLQSQIDLPDLTAQLDDWVEEHLQDALIERQERRPHVTLVYGLDKRDKEGIEQAALDYGRPVRLSLGALNFFDAPEHDVLYLEVISEGILQLRSRLMALPNARPQMHAQYIPHVTLAYLKKGSAAKFKGTTPFHQVVSRDGFSLIDAAGVESFVPTVTERGASSPILLATS